MQGYVDEALVDGPMVLIGEDGAPFFDPRRPVAFFVNEPIWPNNHVHVLRTKPLADPRWLTHALNDADYSLSVFGATRDKLTQAALMSMRLALPPLLEQRAIAAYLDRETAEIDALVAAQEGLIAALRERRAAVVEHELNSLPNYIALRHYIAGVESGVSVNSGGRPAEYGEVAVLKTSVVLRGVFDAKQNKVVDEDREIGRLSCPVRGGTLVVSRMNTPQHVGAAAYAPRDLPWLYLPDRLWQVTFRPQVDARFIDHWTKSRLYRGQVESVCVGTSNSMQNISQEDFRSFKCPQAPLDEQRRIADYLDEKTAEIDALIAETERFIALARERRAALITAAVTGQIDCTQLIETSKEVGR